MNGTGLTALAAALAIALSTIGPALGQGKAAAAALDGMARQPEMAGTLRTGMILALVVIFISMIVQIAMAG